MDKEDDILADHSQAIPEEDFKSDTYVLRKPCLVMFFSRTVPNMQYEKGKRYEKKTITIEDGSSTLANEEVDVDIGTIHDFLSGISRQTKMKPVFKLIRNPTLENIDDKLGELKDKGHKYGSFIFVICSYLDKGDEIEIYNGSVSIDHFFDKIKSFESMAAKPKLFLIQADDKKLIPTASITKGSTTFVTNVVTKKIPTDADKIVIFSTIPQVVVNRQLPAKQHTESGQSVSQSSEEPKSSLLIQAFIDVLRTNANMDLLSNTPFINGKVVELFRELDPTKVDIPVPLVTSTLTKQWLLGGSLHV
ncbi:uncharacterized protein LOC128243624 [Mya arenaria]|uniref:uncharacterized protein LOC128243624 n=1 Tax=Mya arenaria TaxID=6604 RepID=UPI0022E5CC57|nr:uncharacterized protein LOC128243624 [Mya arenaria]